MTSIPFLVPKDNLSRFNASITLVGSISYFIGPLLVGLFQQVNQSVLFILYGSLTISSAFLLLLLPQITLTDDQAKSELAKPKHNWHQLLTIFKSYRNYAYIFLAWVVLEAVASSFDSFEVIFLTHEVGISNAQYAFALSFLAIAFLVVSSLLTFKKIKPNYDRLFYIGSGLFLIYLALVAFCQSYAQLLVFYTFLAFGSTLIGNMLYNITQTEVTTHDQPNIFLLQDVFTSILSAILVMLLGIGQNFGYLLGSMYKVFFTSALVLVLFLCLKRQKKDTISHSLIR
ncbi:MFS transporter [Lapidilactobacillus bayanensis]|uniref:MFS transporter n=1 Tax=Lapidilactobacillus bayanensis TaxID=2485998 RepID=UPI0013DDEE5F|nr:MFS transporter [Lapidilactobacillus bayanensis]